MKKICITASLIVLALTSPAHADDAGHRAAAKKLFALSNSAVNFSDMFGPMMRQMLAPVQEKQTCITDAAINELVEEVEAVVDFKMEDIEDPILKLYMEFFTEQELNDMLAFYATPTGKKTLQVLPQVMQQSMQIGSSVVQNKIPLITQKTQEVLGKYIGKDGQCISK